MSCFKISTWKALLSTKSTEMSRTANQLNGYNAKIVDDSDSNTSYHRDTTTPDSLPETQNQLLLQAAKEEYKLVTDAKLPVTKRDDEAVIQIQTIGLNPIDWKGPAYNFGFPSFPCILGRDYIGTVVRAPRKSRRINVGDVVLGVTTDYRDYRKAAFQEYAVALESNLTRLPLTSSKDKSASIGVAFVTAALVLGVCLGLEFPNGPDLFARVRALQKENLPEDIREECHTALSINERLKPGDWLAVWGAGSTVGFFAVQLAKLAGVRVIAIANAVKRGGLLVDAGADVLIHREHTDEAQEIIRSVTKDKLRFGIDTVGKTSAELLQGTLKSTSAGRAHIVGLTGLPKEIPDGVIQHKLPIKLFHEVPQIGEAIMVWLEDLLVNEKLLLPVVDVYPRTGLQEINEALDRLKSGNLTSQRIVVNMGVVA